MRIRVVRDGKSDDVEVAADLSSASVDGHSYPVTVVAATALRVELEVGGERVLVENWPDHFPLPPSPVDVNGERAPVAIERLGVVEVPRAVPVRTPVPAPPGPTGSSEGPGVPIVPPMPGKVVELRVSEGARVDVGDVLLVLEAMKMRNEVTSPVAGVVRGLRVTSGGNARAREPMLFVAPA